MHAAHDFLRNLAIVLSVAAVTTVVFQRLKQPVVLGYLLAGLIVGPHVPVPLVADRGTIEALAGLGVILLMFSIGLEFRIGKLIRAGPTAGLVALIEISVMIWLGYLTGRVFGWTKTESLFAGALIAISSTTIIAKAFDEQRVEGRLREFVFGVLIVEDLVAVLLLAALALPGSAAPGAGAGSLAATAGKLLGFLVFVLVAGLLVVPRAMRAVVRLGRPETTLVASVGLCFAFALFALETGYSVALGAFIAGSVVAESGEEKAIEPLVEPVRDMFVAVFFVAVGMMIDPALVARNAGAVAVLTLMVVGGKLFGVTVGAFLSGAGLRLSIRAGMSLAQIGEFSFLIAALGLSRGATREFLYPVAVAVSAATALLTPWLIRLSGPVASFVDRKAPKRVQTFAALYATWLEQLRSGSRAPRSAVRRILSFVLVDMAALAAIVIGTSLLGEPALRFIREATGLAGTAARAVLVMGAVLASAPFVVGAVRSARALGQALAERALPLASEGRADLAAAPRRALVVTVQMAVAIAAGLPLLAILQPFVGAVPGLVLALVLLVLLLVFWRRAADLQGHVRAAAEAVAEAFAAPGPAAPHARTLPPMHDILPGLGDPTPVRIDAGSRCAGKRLAELNLRGLTGATILAIRRGSEALLVPTGKDELGAGDLVVLAGTHEAIDAARALLQEPAG